MPFSERKDYFAKQILNKTVLIPLFFVLCTIPSPSALAATVNLAWTPSTGSNIAGYKIYYGTSSRNYSTSVKAGNSTSHSVSGLTAGTKYYFAATAYNTSNAESAYSSELTYTIPATSSSTTSSSTSTSTNGSSGSVIIDNGASGTKASGTWTTSSGSGYYGSKSVYSKNASSSYSFTASRTGAQKVYLWWTTYSTRYSAVPVQIYDGSTLKATVTVNQLQNGGKWNLLGTYSFSGQAKVVILSKSSSKTTCADAVQFIATTTTTSSGSTSSSGTTSSTSSSGTTDSTSPSTSSGTSGSSSTVIIDNGSSGSKASGTWITSSGTGYYGSKSVYSQNASSSYSFAASRTGAQKVYLWWTTYSTRYSAVPVQIYDGSTLKATVTVNQLQNGGKWNLLGTYSFSGQAKVVIVSKSSSKTTCADAVKFVPTSTTSTSTSSGTSGSSNTVIIDNGASGSKASGTWITSSGTGYYGSKSVYSQTVSSSYSFEAARSGSQQVYLWWTYYNTRYNNVPVRIYDGSNLLDTININQLQGGGKWNLLGTYSFSGQAKVVIVSKSSSKTTCADAVKFVPTSTTSTSTSSSSSSSGSTIVDNGDSGTKASGSWLVSGGSGFYGSNSVYSKTASNTYSFETACSGVQEVYLWWSNYSTRCTEVPVKIYDGTTYLDTVIVNQLKNSGQWNALGTFSFSGKAKVVIISNGGCTTSADAVNFFEPN